jgi:hypothetical protein
MSEFQRRDFLKGAAAFAAGVTAALTGARRAEAGDPNFMNNVPDPLLSGKDLPTFKFALEKSKGRVIGKSTAKQAGVEEPPISKGIAGVSMGIEPGGMRELHWHATAAECEGDWRSNGTRRDAGATIPRCPHADRCSQGRGVERDCRRSDEKGPGKEVGKCGL